MSQFSARPIRMVASIASRLAAGSAPGRPRQTGQTWVLGSAPNPVRQPQNIFVFVPSSTCVSRPMTGSYRLIASSEDGNVEMLMRETLVGASDGNPPGFARPQADPTDQDHLGTVSAMQRPLAFLAAVAVLAGCTPDAAPT